MGRPIKNTVEFFPHFAKGSRTLSIIKSRYKTEGYTFWFTLLSILSDTEGHYYDVRNAINWQFLVSETMVSEITATEILNLLAELGAIDTELWKVKVIWVQHLVDNFGDVYQKRGRPLPVKPCISPTFPTTPTVSVPEIITEPILSPLTVPETPQSIVENSIVENSITVPLEIKNNGYHEVFNFWNSQKIIVHEKITDKMQVAIRGAIKDHTIQEIETSIQNYSMILKSPDYYFKYEWELKDFLNRGLDKFLDIDRAKRNYLKDNPTTKDKKEKPPRNKEHWGVR